MATTSTQTPSSETPPQPLTHEQSIDKKLETIIFHLERLDKRDRWRTIWGSIHGAITIIPVLFTLVVLWFLYTHGQQLIQLFASAAMGTSQQAVMQELQKYMK